MSTLTPTQLAKLAGHGYTPAMHPIARTVTIALELDSPDLTIGMEAEYARAARPIRLVPCKGGVRIQRAGSSSHVYATPADMACELVRLAWTAWRKGFGLEGTATGDYWLDCARFLTQAAKLVRRDARILRLWGLA